MQSLFLLTSRCFFYAMQVNEAMALMVSQVPSYKWLPLTYQLSSRLGTNPPAKRYSPTDDHDDGSGAATSARAAATAENQSLSPSDSDAGLEPVTTFAQVNTDLTHLISWLSEQENRRFSLLSHSLCSKTCINIGSLRFLVTCVRVVVIMLYFCFS